MTFHGMADWINWTFLQQMLDDWAREVADRRRPRGYPPGPEREWLYVCQGALDKAAAAAQSLGPGDSLGVDAAIEALWQRQHAVDQAYGKLVARRLRRYPWNVGVPSKLPEREEQEEEIFA